MKKLNNRLWQWGLTLLFGVFVVVFWRYRFPQALSYQEQFQLFLFDADYLREALSVPGGVCRYVAEFLVQFYNVLVVGALVLAVLMMLLQRLTWRLAAPSHNLYYPLSFLPAVVLCYTLGDESVLLTFVVSLLCSVLFMLLSPRGMRAKILYALVSIPLVYWLAGPLVWLLAVYMVCRLLQDERPTLRTSFLGLCLLLFTLVVILLSTRLVNYPLNRLMSGLFYYRFPLTVTLMMGLTALLTLAVPLVMLYLPQVKGKVAPLLVVVQTVVLGLLVFTWVPKGFDERKYELIDYDYLVRLRDWKAIIAKAEAKHPDLPMSVAANNLALAMTGQLGNRIFEFYQHGSDGLLPRFERNFNTAQLTGEIYFHLGLVNSAQRFAFEAMEAIPDCRKSVRVIKRLAETNLINGQYAVAAKYLHLLKKTIFYQRWAQRTEALIGHEADINNHPVYGWLRKASIHEDFLFSEKETDKICGQLFLHNNQNMMAAQYLLMLPLLDRDLNRFMQYVPVVQERVRYNPSAVQEAVAFAYAQQGQEPPQEVVGPLAIRGLNEFLAVARENGRNAVQLQRFRTTVWYYLTQAQ